MAPLFTFITFSFLLPCLAFAAPDQQCYGLNGTPLDSSYAPCKSNSKVSGCCATRRTNGSPDICLDNGLCMATEGIYMGTIWQNGCTDHTGKDPNCPVMCPDARTKFGNLRPVVAWNVQTCGFGSYCCRESGDSRSCCLNATSPDILITTSSIGKFQFTISAATATLVNTASTSTIATSTSVPPSTQSTEVPAGQAIPQATHSSSPSLICKPDRSATVGGAVGGVLGAIVLGLTGLILWMYKKEKKQRKLKEHYEEQFGQNFAYRRTIVVESDSREVLATPTSDFKSMDGVKPMNEVLR